MLTSSSKLQSGEMLQGTNIEVHHNGTGLSCMSHGAGVFDVPALSLFNTVPSLGKLPAEEKTPMQVKKTIGLTEDEVNLMNVIPSDILAELYVELPTTEDQQF